MFSPELYNPIYHQGMLLAVLLTALIYTQGISRLEFSTGFNAFMIWAVGLTLIFFLGTRPIDNVFVDMTTYATSFRMAQGTGYLVFPDWGFNFLTNAVASFAEVETFFFICALAYIAPLIFAALHRHGAWANAAFLALAGGFSFYSYGVNGIRNGIATSLLVAAFAFSDRKIVMVLLMVIAEGMHKSSLLPIAAFLVAGVFARPIIYFATWMGALVLSYFLGSQLPNYFVGIMGSGEDDRLGNYASNAGFGADKGGFRPDFVLYSIVPLIISYALAEPTTRKDPFYRRLVCTYLLANSFWLLVMYAAYSNRFAYLSWFMMPWVIIYPFIPKTSQPNQTSGPADVPRLGLLGLALIAHFAFTYIMMMFVYPSRGG